jgi:uncharacterized protein
LPEAVAKQLFCAVHITFDPTKNERDIRERGLSFEQVRDFDFETALIEVDARREYGETRLIALGFLHKSVHVLCFTETPKGIRVISFLKANDRDVARYGPFETTD